MYGQCLSAGSGLAEEANSAAVTMPCVTLLPLAALLLMANAVETWTHLLPSPPAKQNGSLSAPAPSGLTSPGLPSTNDHDITVTAALHPHTTPGPAQIPDKARVLAVTKPGKPPAGATKPEGPRPYPPPRKAPTPTAPSSAPAKVLPPPPPPLPVTKLPLHTIKLPEGFQIALYTQQAVPGARQLAISHGKSKAHPHAVIVYVGTIIKPGNVSPNESLSLM